MCIYIVFKVVYLLIFDYFLLKHAPATKKKDKRRFTVFYPIYLFTSNYYLTQPPPTQKRTQAHTHRF